MSIGLCGAHRVGKSTLAEAYSNETDMPLVLIHSGSVFERFGFHPEQNLTISERLTVQEAILDHAIEQYAAENELFITDRTPIDMLAYTLHYLSLSPETMTEFEFARLKRYEQRCIDISNSFFEVILLIQPGIPLVEAPMKAKLCPLRQKTINSILRGLMIDRRITSICQVLEDHVLSLEDRKHALDHCLEMAWIDINLERDENKQLH